MSARLEQHLNRATEVICEKSRERVSLKSDTFVIATGKLFGGGIHLGSGETRETVANLPLFVARNVGLTCRSELDWTPRSFRKDQPWAKLGVWVNHRWCPRDETNREPLENVRACGSIIGGIDWAHAGMGLGFGALSGGLCAEA